jgi:hypothetical protein
MITTLRDQCVAQGRFASGDNACSGTNVKPFRDVSNGMSAAKIRRSVPG